MYRSRDDGATQLSNTRLRLTGVRLATGQARRDFRIEATHDAIAAILAGLAGAVAAILAWRSLRTASFALGVTTLLDWSDLWTPAQKRANVACAQGPMLRVDEIRNRLRQAVGRAFLIAAVSAFVPRLAHAHFILIAPDSWMSQDSFGLPEKLGPCGDEGGGTPTAAVTAFRSGQAISVTINEVI